MLLNKNITTWATRLIEIRVSDAIKTEFHEVTHKFYQHLQKCQNAGESDPIGKALEQLEDHGFIRRYTICNFMDRSAGYQGFWDASLPLLANLDSIDSFISRALTSEHVPLLRAYLDSLVETTPWRGCTLPPLAHSSRQVQADLSCWYRCLSFEIAHMKAKVETLLGTLEQCEIPHLAQHFRRLEVAMANADVDIHGLADAVALCRTLAAGTVADSTVLAKAEDLLTQKITQQLSEARDGLDSKNLWVTWTRLLRLMRKCKTMQLNVPGLGDCEQLVYQELRLSDDLKIDVIKIPRTEEFVLNHFQKLMDLTRCEGFMGQPRLRVERIIEVMHECTRAEYLLQRSKLVTMCSSDFKQIQVKSHDLSWENISSQGLLPPEARYNEFYTFHGTSPSVAQAITETDFKIKRHPKHGYTFGRGVYLSEYSTHAQFFAAAVTGGFGDGSGRCAIIVCRVFCGRIQDAGHWEHTACEHDRKDEFEKNLEDQQFESTMGYEWPCAPELREFVLPDDDQVLPEFIVVCKVF